MRCLNVKFYALFSERRRGRVVETLKKSSGMLQTFWVRFSITPIHFQCFEIGQHYVLDGTVIHYKYAYRIDETLFIFFINHAVLCLFSVFDD